MSIEVDAIVYKHAHKQPLTTEEKATLAAWEARLDNTRRVVDGVDTFLEDTRKAVVKDYARKLAG